MFVASKKSQKNKLSTQQKKEWWYHTLKDETKHSILSIFTLTIATILTLSGFGVAGMAGRTIFNFLSMLLGAGYFLMPLVLFLAGIALLLSKRPHFIASTTIGAGLFLLSGLGATELIFGKHVGGYIGYIFSWPFLKFFDFWASLIIFSAIFLVALLIILNTAITIKNDEEDEEEEKPKKKEPTVMEKLGNLSDMAMDSVKGAAASIKEVTEKRAETPTLRQNDLSEVGAPTSEDVGVKFEKRKVAHTFTPPPLDLLNSDSGKPSSGDIKANANIIKRTLQNFGIDVEMGEINIGPSVTQYTLKPAEGIKLSRILALQNDLALALAAHPLRIEAPIPGKSLVGIEIPNRTKTTVGLRDLFMEDAFQKSAHPLLVVLGKDVSGKAIFANLAKMPHMLVAGATGSGKSISIHTIIASLLYRNSPESLRFIMVDPKRVELTFYNKIPHILTPVITEPKKAVLALKWACKEMDRRYEILLKNGVKDISSYHEKHGEYNSMPYLVIIVDELADLMSTYPREMESSIVRLSQMSRAVGIHLILSTQRPSVEVITGLIKANITSRIALQVASQIDSRTILDMAGAEKLLGSGDMLFLAGDSAKPKRIQGPFITEKETKNIVEYLAKQYKDIDLEDLSVEQINNIAADPNSETTKVQSSFNIDLTEDNNSDDIDDDLYEEARETIMKTNRASTSYLQRKLRIGYARAARLIDMLEERGVVGPSDGAKPREVLIRENDTSNESR